METKTRIIVVDDNCDFRDNIKEALEEHNFLVDSSSNGKEAIILASKSSYDIALMDIKLPDIPGNKVIEKIAEISPSTEFIIMTAHATLDSAIESVKQKGVTY